MNPETAIILAEEGAALVRTGALMLDESAVKGVVTGTLKSLAGETLAVEGWAAKGAVNKGAGQLFADMAAQFKSAKPFFPDAEALLKEPVKGLESRFIVNRDIMAKVLEPGQKLLPQLGLHGTSMESGSTMLANRSAGALDFATFPDDSAMKGIPTYISEVGRSTETAVSFSEKWNGLWGKNPGPVMVMDIGKAKQFMNVPIPYEYGGTDMALTGDLLPQARQFKGTIYGLEADRFSQIVSGSIDFNSTQTARPLIELLNKNALEQIAGGIPKEQVYADLWARGNVLSATRRLDLAHQALTRWLTQVS